MLLAAGTAMVWASHVGAAQALLLTNEVFQEIEVKSPDGKLERKTIPAARVVPGTEVIYVITYKNEGDKPAEKITVTNPVPKELEYVTAPSIAGESAAEVSVDGGKNYGALPRLTVAGTDGKPRPATTSDVTHVRWSLKSIVEPGDEGKVSFRAKLK
jgi:uncharacterized repeat protein (TIGR01451 family)